VLGAAPPSTAGARRCAASTLQVATYPGFLFKEERNRPARNLCCANAGVIRFGQGETPEWKDRCKTSVGLRQIRCWRAGGCMRPPGRQMLVARAPLGSFTTDSSTYVVPSHPFRISPRQLLPLATSSSLSPTGHTRPISASVSKSSSPGNPGLESGVPTGRRCLSLKSARSTATHDIAHGSMRLAPSVANG
jgi:hypothetical protein